jgi:hypothetical protein
VGNQQKLARHRKERAFLHDLENKGENLERQEGVKACGKSCQEVNLITPLI